METQKKISCIIPTYNEEGNLPILHQRLSAVFNTFEPHIGVEFIFVDDGSQDKTHEKLKEIEQNDSRVRTISFSRNFGKEIALTAGLHHAQGDAALMIDADLQHPPEIIPQFITAWANGAEVVVGVRDKKRDESPWVKRKCASLFYIIMNKIGDTNITPFATDFRLIDRVVIDAFNECTEHHRITRGLIDWLGFRREYITFVQEKRKHGTPQYNYYMLIRLALWSIATHSLFPLRVAGYLGLVTVMLAAPLGLFIFIERYVLGDPLHLHFSGPAILAVIILFLVGIVLCSVGIVAMYIGQIHNEVLGRPLYVIRRKKVWENTQE